MLTLFMAAVAAAQAPADQCEARLLDYAGWRETPGQQWDYRWRAEGDCALRGQG